MRTTDEFFAAHLCGWDQAALSSEAPADTTTAAARHLSRRQVLNGIGVLTAAALLTACTQPQQPTPAAPGATGAPTTVERRR